MITPQTYIQEYHIKPLPVSRVFGARSGSPRIMFGIGGKLGDGGGGSGQDVIN